MRSLRLAAAAAALVLFGGCQAAVRVGIDANDHGGGRVVAVVTLDRDAQKVVGDLKGKLRVDDLKRAGWRIDGPTKSGTDVEITATKPFTSAAGAARAIRQLDGGSGLFSGFTVVQHRSLLRTTTRVHGTVDLRKGIDAFSDPKLTEALGTPLGATSDEFAQRIGTELAKALPITVGVRLPGKVTSNAPVEDGGSAAWHPKLGDRITVAASAKKWNVLPIALGALAVLAAGTALIVGLGRRATPSP
ncbi:MAG TPA: hypothetical protein VHD87_00970 [Acidimicrobiales bacterium]|nr:hypothetical protein [Acidimicrobiales bacterium]